MSLQAATTFQSGRSTILPPLEEDDTQPRSRTGDRFIEDGQLGIGGVGEVVRALDVDIGRRVAIKRLRADRRDASNLTRFVREVRLVGTLEHPNIVPLHDVGRTGSDEIYAVMKWIDGRTLHQLIEELRAGDPELHARFPFDARVRIFLEVCRGIAYAHERSILHRDIKPGNIMLGSNGEVQILDWGLAKARKVSTLPDELAPAADGWANETVAGSVLGTPAYMAPEQAAGAGYDERSEVFALGLLLWELLTLQPLSDEHTTTDEALRDAQTRRVRWATHVPAHPAQGPVPANLAWIIDRAVKPVPADRYQNVQQLLEAIEGAVAGQFEVKCLYSLHQRMLSTATHWHDRHPAMFPFVAIGSVLGLFSAGVGVGAWLL